MSWEENNETKELDFRRFLFEQVSLPEAEWDERFKQYVAEKYRESLQKAPELEPEEERERNFQRYLKSLDLKKDDLLGKRILDLGCGEGDFVKYCLSEGISQEVFGLDLQNEPDKINPVLRKYFLKGDFEKELPLKELDYIISVAAVKAPYSEDIEKDLRKILILALTSIKHNGEIRIFPVRKAPPGSGLKAIDYSRKKWLDVLERLASKGLIKYELRPIDIKVGGKKPDVWLEQVLIIQRKADF